MFTGIVQHLGRVATTRPEPFGARLMVDSSSWDHRPAIGDSIAVNGCCVTVANRAEHPGGGGALQFDVIAQTLKLTTLGQLRAGDHVNLEHAVTPQTVLGGHIVQGHIDAVGTVAEVKDDQADRRVRIRVPAAAAGEMMACIVDQGSIAVNGVSLTIATTGEDWFEVALIPTTLKLTNLGMVQEGTPVNLEVDYLAKIVVNYLRRTGRT